MINKIMEHIVTDKKYRDLCRFHLPPNRITKDNIDEVLQEVVVRAYDYREAIIRAHADGYLKQYINRMICTVVKHKQSEFVKSARVFPAAEYIAELRASDTASDKANRERIIKRFEQNELKRWQEHRQNMASPHWYKARLLELYIKLGSMRKVSRETGIPLTSIHLSIKEYREVLRKR